MKIVLITGSPRSKGNTELAAESFEKAAIANGAEVVKFDAYKMNLLPCRACNACFGEKGPCVFNDDFNKIMPEIMSADAVVWATPVYWYTWPGYIKNIIDKLYSIYPGGKAAELEGKKTALIAICEEHTPSTFAGLTYAFDKTFELCKMEIVDKVLIPATHNPGDIKNNDGEARAAALAHKLCGK